MTNYSTIHLGCKANQVLLYFAFDNDNDIGRTKMKIMNLFLSFNLAFSWGYCDDQANQKTQIQRIGMILPIVHQKEKLFIGFELRTNNEECSLAMPAHKDKFFQEDIISKIPNKIDGNILALYTDYEGDQTQPYSWILGCEVTSLEHVPQGLVGKVI